MPQTMADLFNEVQEEYDAAQADYAAAELRLRKAKARMAPLTHLKKAIAKIPPELAAGVTLAFSEDGEVVQDA